MCFFETTARVLGKVHRMKCCKCMSPAMVSIKCFGSTKEDVLVVLSFLVRDGLQVVCVTPGMGRRGLPGPGM